MCFIDAHVCLIVCVGGCAQRYMPPPGSVGVPSLWHRHFGGCRSKSLETPSVDDKNSTLSVSLCFCWHCSVQEGGRWSCPPTRICLCEWQHHMETRPWHRHRVGWSNNWALSSVQRFAERLFALWDQIFKGLRDWCFFLLCDTYTIRAGVCVKDAVAWTFPLGRWQSQDWLETAVECTRQNSPTVAAHQRFSSSFVSGSLI